MWWFEETVQSYKGFNISELNIDEAWLNISSMFSVPVWLYILSDNCHQCPFQIFMEDPILPNFSYKSIRNVQYGTAFRFRTQGNSSYASVSEDPFKVCDLRDSLGEFGVYSLYVESGSSHGSPVHCVLKRDLDPVDIYMPIIGTLLFWIIVGLIFSSAANYKTSIITVLGSLFNRVISSFVQRNLPVDRVILHNDETDAGTSGTPKTANVGQGGVDNEVTPLVETPNEELPSSSLTTAQRCQNNPIKERLKSLHAFRGLFILIMIFVDDDGGGYYFFRHCTWDGLYAADLAFPWFIWICGVCIPLSLHPKMSSGSPKLTIFIVILKRSLKLIVLGLMVNTSTRAAAVQLENLRFPGVLQRFGVCYFVGSSLFLWLSQAAGSPREPQGWKVYFSDIATIIIPWIFVIACAGLHTVLLFTLHVPDCPHRYNLINVMSGFKTFLVDIWDLVAYIVIIQYQSIALVYLQCLYTLDISKYNCKHNLNGNHHLACLFSSQPLIAAFTVECGRRLGSGLGNLDLEPSLASLSDASLPSMLECPGTHTSDTSATGYVDRLIFGQHHIHNRPTSNAVYGSGAFDPEGALGVLTSILHVWLGTQAGIILLLIYRSSKARIYRFLIWSVFCGILGLFLCGGFRNEGWIPVNKNLWSLSFVLVTSSAALLLLTLLYLVIDVLKLWSGSPLLETGMNSIFLYLGHEVCHTMLPWHYAYGRMQTHISRLFESSWGTVLWILLAVYLHRRKLFFVV